MSEPAFTKGPWFVDEDARAGMAWNRHICAGEHDRICFMSNSGDSPSGEANANLIAAAPEGFALAEAYERWEADVILNADWSGDLPRLRKEQWDGLLEIQAMRNAYIAKARGESA